MIPHQNKYLIEYLIYGANNDLFFLKMAERNEVHLFDNNMIIKYKELKSGHRSSKYEVKYKVSYIGIVSLISSLFQSAFLFGNLVNVYQ